MNWQLKALNRRCGQTCFRGARFDCRSCGPCRVPAPQNHSACGAGGAPSGGGDIARLLRDEGCSRPSLLRFMAALVHGIRGSDQLPTNDRVAAKLDLRTGGAPATLASLRFSSCPAVQTVLLRRQMLTHMNNASSRCRVLAPLQGVIPIFSPTNSATNRTSSCQLWCRLRDWRHGCRTLFRIRRDALATLSCGAGVFRVIRMLCQRAIRTRAWARKNGKIGPTSRLSGAISNRKRIRKVGPVIREPRDRSSRKSCWNWNSVHPIGEATREWSHLLGQSGDLHGVLGIRPRHTDGSRLRTRDTLWAENMPPGWVRGRVAALTADRFDEIAFVSEQMTGTGKTRLLRRIGQSIAAIHAMLAV